MNQSCQWTSAHTLHCVYCDVLMNVHIRKWIRSKMRRLVHVCTLELVCDVQQLMMAFAAGVQMGA